MSEIGQFDKTILAERRVKTSGFYEEPSGETPHGSFRGRPIIGKDMPVEGGVYLGAGAREAIVVDEKYGELVRIYKRVREELEKESGKGALSGRIFRKVFDIVKEELPFDQKKVDGEVAQFNGDTKVALDHFIQKKAGVCRHQALLTAYLFQKLKQDGIVQGSASIDRNAVSGKGGHAWVRYTNRVGDVFIIDPAQDYIGPLKDESLKDRWFYKRPEDT